MSHGRRRRGRLCLSAGLQAPWNPPERAGGSVLGEESLGSSARAGASTSRPRIRAWRWDRLGLTAVSIMPYIQQKCCLSNICKSVNIKAWDRSVAWFFSEVIQSLCCSNKEAKSCDPSGSPPTKLMVWWPKCFSVLEQDVQPQTAHNAASFVFWSAWTWSHLQ